jgi:hypothetical protein
MGMWDWESLWLKSKKFIDKANGEDREDPEFGLQSALALELLGRAALSHIHPALNADPKKEGNLFHALGLPAEQPRSIPAHSVSARLERFIPGFEAKPHGALFDFMSLQRNIDLHTGEVPFANTSVDRWLPDFYASAKILCEKLGKTLREFLGDEVGEAAEKMVAAFAIAQEKAVKGRISKHGKEFEAKPGEERAALLKEAEVRTKGLRVGSKRETCPACGSPGILNGEFIREHDPVYEEGELLVDKDYLATEFRCPACELHLRSIAEVGLAEIDLQFTEREATSLHERFQPEWEDEYENM